MGTCTHRRLLVALLVLALVVGPTTVTSTDGATGSPAAGSLAESGTVMATGDLTQTDSGTLRFELDAERVGNESTVDVLIESGGKEATIPDVSTDTEADGVYTYTVASNTLPEFSLANATVHVYQGTGGNRTDLLTEREVDLRHLDLAEGAGSFDEDGRLALSATNDTAGLDDASFEDRKSVV